MLIFKQGEGEGTQVEITYFGDDEPDVVVTGPNDIVEVRFIDGEEARWLFLDYNGMKIYVTYQLRHGEDYLSSDWFNPKRGMDDEKDESFDVEDLPEVPAELEEKYAQLFPVAETAGLEEWEKEQAERKRRMAYAIDCAWLTEDGLDVDAIVSAAGIPGRPEPRG
jgi:hypothetical protein